VSVVLLYDGTCTMCQRAVRLLERVDRGGGRLVFVPSGDREAMRSSYPMVPVEDLEHAMYAVSDGRCFRGYDAFVAAFAAVPVTRALSQVMRFVPVRAVGLLVYAIVAKNRKRLGCASDACRVP
jgi:predicted DCC family thiol-disulfide oxidoreductase YuxK